MTSIQSVPLRERSHFDIQKDSKNVLGSSFTSDDALCPGCGTSAIREEGGLVVAFGYVFRIQRWRIAVQISQYLSTFRNS